MKPNWSKKSQSLFEKWATLRFTSDSTNLHKLYFDETFYLLLDAEYPLNLRWCENRELAPKELFVLLLSLQELSKSMVWSKWIHLRTRELENFLRDQNHINAIPVELLDQKKVDFYLGLLFEEHFKLQVVLFLERLPFKLSQNYLENHRSMNQLFKNISSFFSCDFSLYQITPQEILFHGDKNLPTKFPPILASLLSNHFAPGNLKFVAIEV